MNGDSHKLAANPVSFARSYQLEALEKALEQNTVVFFETGTGKTLIAIMLLRSYAHLLRKPSPHIAVFLVPTVVLVTQQGEAVSVHTDLRVGHYYGELGVDFWNAAMWKHEVDQHEVLVMTPQILLNALRHKFLGLEQIKVLIFDECHNARGKHPYACIMTEFYHRELASSTPQLPRIFGMTASPIKAKASNSSAAYWKQISELENLMNSKVYTCESNEVIAQHVPNSTAKLKEYNHVDISQMTHACLYELNNLLSKAAEVYSRQEDVFLWDKMDISVERVLRAFSSDAVKAFSQCIASGSHWSSCQDLMHNMSAGYLTSKVMCLIEILLEYREASDLRCIIFVQRIVTSIVLKCFLNELLPNICGWTTEYTAGNTSKLRSQSRKEQNAIIDKFRNGKVNIIVSTSLLEEGLDVQSCNLVIRFDASANLCSFIQSRGRARMQNSDFVLMVKSGDGPARARVESYLSGVDIMRRECVEHYDVPCEPLGDEMHGEPWYEVESTKAIVTLSSSVSLLYYYCSRLPSDGYFKPHPRFSYNKELESCTLHLPNNCPIQTVAVQGSTKFLKPLVCLEACKELHKVGALTDYLVPDIVEEERDAQYCAIDYHDEHSKYFPPELLGSCDNKSETLYHCYLLELKSNCQYDVNLQDILLVVRTKLPTDLEGLSLDFDIDRGSLTVHIKYIGYVMLSSVLVSRCQRFQLTIFKILLDHNLNKLSEEMDKFSKRDGSAIFDYLLLPALHLNGTVNMDWKSINAVLYPENTFWDEHTHCFSTRGHGHYVHTKDSLVCCCHLEKSLVRTPHNDYLYCVTGTLDGIDGNTNFTLEDGTRLTYKRYYEQRHGISLQFEGEFLLHAKRIFNVQNYLHRCRTPTKKESSTNSYELPPELCSIIMAPVSVSTFYTFSFLPSVMHRIQSLLMAYNLKTMHLDPCGQNVVVPTVKVLEAITTKKCQEKIHLESLETLGDSFLKYVATKQLFQVFQNRHEGLLSAKRERIICNATLCKLGCDRKITGFVRNEPFDPKAWIIPGSNCADHILGEEVISSTRFGVGRIRKLKSKIIADVVEALIGAYLSTGGEAAALSFMVWLGIEIDSVGIPYTRNFAVKPEVHVNIGYFQSLLNYTFRDASLLVEALTHGSYMLPEIPGCYQRLEFLGDAVLDYLITKHLYYKYPNLSPGLLTDLRSASVNNECYALSAIKAGLYKHVLHTSQVLHKQIVHSVRKFKESGMASTFGWESETTFPKVLGDVIESLAGAIYVDSGYNKEVVFECMRPLLEPLVSPETVKLHPVRELSEVCQREHYVLMKPVVSYKNGVAHATVEVDANGVLHRETCCEADKKTAKKLACKAVLKSLKESMLSTMSCG
ncbi:endoribonuclease Dicer homolog 2 isoform X2 [Andrographis paniculata]|uniref:endoribonuclease Dicer homolog 2 isoform X2 n=1 Tax=Andrographis paniculata TaxID=175694 RepID=UPI0021E72AA7|nr:endoribonuclease Dicer homolog 2 isoform X2 [Andrographis paniculata]